MAIPTLLRLPRLQSGTSNEADFIIVHVSSAGTHPLDLELIGTENTAVFAVSLKHNQTSLLMVKNSPYDQEEWDLILSSVLLDAVREDALSSLMHGVEAVAKVEADGSSITIFIQKRIEGITQRLGSITLPSNEDAEVDLYEWCGLTVKSKNIFTDELVALKIKFEEQEDRIRRLDQSFQELLKLKNEHETELLEKFSRLLNEKKLKIRDQQRLLASSNVDPEKLAGMNVSPHVESRAPGASRPSKRKAGKNVRGQSDDDGSVDAFEEMEIDQLPNDSGQEQAQTPEEESTADEQEDSGKDEPSALSPSRLTVDRAKEFAMGSESTRAEDDITVPPRRELPFAKKVSAPATKPPAVAADSGSDTESDDEL